MSNQCQHGQLARVCELCEKNAEIRQLRQYLDAAQRRGEELRAQVAGLEVDAERLKMLMRSVVTELDDDAPNGPGHAHEKPGVWDESNKSNLAGKPCKWCALWADFRLAARKGAA